MSNMSLEIAFVELYGLRAQGNRTWRGGKDLILSNASLEVESSSKAGERLSEENDPALELLICDCPGSGRQGNRIWRGEKDTLLSTRLFGAGFCLRNAADPSRRE